MATEGQIAINKKTGARAVYTGGQWVSADAKQQPMEASMRSRTDIGLAPMVQAQQDMSTIEAQGNPYAIFGPGSTSETRNNAIAEVMSNLGVNLFGNEIYPLRGLAKTVGGEDYQRYEQAQKAFESQLMPLMSGAAVSPSEAQRQIRAAQPELGDARTNLAAKGRQREMMLNGAAKAKGLPLPYPNVPTWGINTTQLPQSRAGGGASGPVRVNSPDEAARLPRGTVFITPDGRRKVR